MKKISFLITVLIMAVLLLHAMEGAIAEAGPATPTDLEPTEEESIFTVIYHQNDKAPQAKQEEITAGILFRLPGAEQIGFKTDNMVFAGWKVFREDDQKWLMESAQGKRKWYDEKVAESGIYTYAVLQENEILDAEMCDGGRIHLYAQWRTAINPEHIRVKLIRRCDDEVPKIGSVIHFIAEVKGCDPSDYRLQWQSSEDNKNWKDIEGANGDQYDITVNEENQFIFIRFTLSY